MMYDYRLPSYRDVLWAKKSDHNAEFKWLPLKQHLTDVSEVMKLLWEHWLCLRQRKEVIRSLSLPSETVAKNLVGFLGAVHDIGKGSIPVILKNEL
jgi:CRISPR-associated endonuclease/helicase Cas3